MESFREGESCTIRGRANAFLVIVLSVSAFAVASIGLIVATTVISWPWLHRHSGLVWVVGLASALIGVAVYSMSWFEVHFDASRKRATKVRGILLFRGRTKEFHCSEVLVTINSQYAGEGATSYHFEAWAISEEQRHRLIGPAESQAYIVTPESKMIPREWKSRVS
jgi:hypothetical protein